MVIITGEVRNLLAQIERQKVKTAHELGDRFGVKVCELVDRDDELAPGEFLMAVRGRPHLVAGFKQALDAKPISHEEETYEHKTTFNS